MSFQNFSYPQRTGDFRFLLAVIKTLNDYDDVLNVAFTCKELIEFVKVNWSIIKPDAVHYQNRFTNRLKSHFIRHQDSPFIRAYNEPEILPIVAQVNDGPESITSEHTVASNQTFVLPHRINYTVTSLKLATSATSATLYIAGDIILHIEKEEMFLFKNKDGSVELMQFFKFLVWVWHHDVSIKCSNVFYSAHEYKRLFSITQSNINQYLTVKCRCSVK